MKISYFAYRSWPLRRQFAVAIFGVGVIGLGMAVFTQTRHEETIRRGRSRNTGQVLAESLADLCVARLANHQTPALKQALAHLAQLPRFAYIQVLSPQGRPVIAFMNAQRPQAVDVLNFSLPLMEGPRLLGSLRAGIWLQGLETEIRHGAREEYVSVLILAGLLALLSSILGGRLAARLARVSTDIQERHPMNFSPLGVEGSDEVSRLTKAFNERQERLREAHEQQARAERAREDMVNMIVHDLKGPIGAFYAGLNILEETWKASHDKETQELLRLMEVNTRRLLRMIDSILQVARLEDETLPVAQDPVDVLRLARSRMQEAHLTADRRGIHMQSSFPTGDGPVIAGDSDLLGRVVDNLLFNALEHTPTGGTVTVGVRVLENSLRMEVSDTGPGIPASEESVIFEKFRKGITHPSRGVGLGLAFCKLAVERHGGTMGVVSASPAGAVFYFELPLAVNTGSAYPSDIAHALSTKI